MATVVVYSRPGCHLCDGVRRVLDTAGVTYDEVDIDRDEALKAEYGWIVPAVAVGGRLVYEVGMDPAVLPGLLRETEQIRTRPATDGGQSGD
ncbi:MAG TPA: glutaredoxin [Actinomycetota bacterium]|nr:glutaredoxin [Actinomycetota bacterium]